jgi:2',3'-cyclic-nucleotide 2'-phosphodiesterase
VLPYNAGGSSPCGRVPPRPGSQCPMGLESIAFMPVRILCLGDVVGRPGRMVLAAHLPELIEQRQIDLVVCNAENAAGGSGITPQIVKKLIRYGVDVVTLGDHAFRKREVIQVLEQSDRVIRPANFLQPAAGKRWTVVETKDQHCRVGVTNVLGQMYMGCWNSPWPTLDKVLAEMPEDIKVRVVDFHAEASSEKIAMSWYLNGKVSVVFGTHTHIPTADARVLDKGTACISDVGMCGPYESVLGRRVDRVLSALTTSMATRFDIATGDPRMCGVLVAVDPATGKAESIERIEVKGQVPDGGAYDEDDGHPKTHGNS